MTAKSFTNSKTFDEPSLSDTAEAVLRIASDFSTDRQTYKAGETVILKLENISEQTLGYNLCTAVLEQSKDNGWLALPSLRLCAAIIYSLEPGKTTTYPYDLDGNLPVGEYRFVARIHSMQSGASGRRVSNVFVVEE